MLLRHLKYSMFPSYETPGEGGGAAAPAAEPAPASPPASEPSASPVPAPSTGAEVPVQLDETTSFALEAFDAMNSDDVELPDEAPPPTEVSAPVVQTPAFAAPVTPAPAQPASATPPVQAAAAAPQVPAPTAEPSAPAAVAPQQSTPPQTPQGFEQIAEELTKQQEHFIEKLAEANYKLTDADLEEFAINPGKVIQKIASRFVNFHPHLPHK